MNFDEFTGEVQHQLELSDTGETLRAIRAVLTTLGERLQAGVASDLAGSLPMEIDRYLLEADSGQQFDWDEFVDRIWEREEMTDPNDRADAVYHARVVLAILDEAVPSNEVRQLRNQLPDDEDWNNLFELIDVVDVDDDTG